jgi:RND family efflux transporter MFP subunit
MSAETKKSHFGFVALLIVAIAGIGAGVYYQLNVRKGEAKALAATVAESPESKNPVVALGRVRMAQGEGSIEIPGQTVALTETPIYTRTDGYLKRRLVDIGQHVHKGDLLIELDTPDLDQQISQARATLTQSQASLAQLQANVKAADSTLRLTRMNAQRSKALADQGVGTRQDADNQAAAAETAEANLHAVEESVRAQQALIDANAANVNRLLEQKKYARLEAPFDGVVTYRNPAASDVGTLISSGSNSAIREVLRISQVQTLRVFVDVPQSYAPFIQLDQKAELVFDEFAGRKFPAKVQSTTGAVDPTTRTMLTVLLVDNPKEQLLPGMYTKVRFHLAGRVNVPRLPADALLLRSEGPQAAVVDDSNRVHLTKLTLGRDYGSELEVISGLSAGDRVVQNPTDAIREGVVIQPKEKAAK